MKNKMETGNKDKQFVVKSREYNFFYRSAENYTTDLYEAKIYNANEIPEDIKNNPNLKVIDLNSEEGLEIIASEINKSERCMSIKSNSLGEVIAGLDNLKRLFKKVKKEPY